MNYTAIAYLAAIRDLKFAVAHNETSVPARRAEVARLEFELLVDEPQDESDRIIR